MPEPTCVAYVRVSTERQADERVTSLADQEAACRGLAAKLGHEVQLWFRDAGASGATVQGRPAFMELLRWCEANRRPARALGVVAVLNDSRFGRFPDSEEATYWRQHLKRLGWVVRFAEGDDVQGELRAVVRALGSVQATEYRKALVANTRRGMKGAATLGYWTREAPYGFRRRVEGSGRVLERGELKTAAEKVRLTPHEEESRVVLWAFEAYAAGGESLGTLADKLRVRVPGRRWSRAVVGALLRNDAYRGAVVGGRRRDEGSEVYGREDAHPAIVSSALFQAVQDRLRKNGERGRGVVPSDYLLSGLLRCVHCGQAYTGGGGGRSRTLKPRRSHRRFYKDNGGILRVCPGRMGTVTRHLVDERVVEVLASTLSGARFRRTLLRHLDAQLQDAGAPDSEPQLRTERARLEQKRERLVAAVADGALLREEAAAQLARIRQAVQEVEGRLQALRFSRGRNAAEERDRVLEIALGFRVAAERMSGAHLRELVEPWIQAATFDKVTRHLTLGIRALPSLQAAGWPARGLQLQGPRPLIRRVNLTQQGHSYRAALAAMEVGR